MQRIKRYGRKKQTHKILGNGPKWPGGRLIIIIQFYYYY